MSNFTPDGTGGFIASKIDEQDGVAVRLILEILAEMVAKEVDPSVIGTMRISCEVGDDIMIFDDDHLRLISVKNSALTPRQVVEESMRLTARLSSLQPRAATLRVLCIVGETPIETSKMSSSLDDLRRVLSSAVDEGKTVADWQAANQVVVQRETKAKRDRPGKPKRTVQIDGPETFMIKSFTHRMDTEQTKADVSRLFRKIIPLTDFSDQRVDAIYRDMVATLGETRRARGTLSISDVTRLLREVVLPPRVQAELSAHRLTKYGYSIDPRVAKTLEEDFSHVRTASKRAAKRMRHALRGGLLADLLRGPVRCIECGHPLTANFGGFGSRGLACSSCGFAPFLSILYACVCGEPCLVVDQPSTVQAELMIEIRQGATGSCPACSEQFDQTRFAQRTFVAAMPWPPEQFTHQVLIDARIDAGLHQPIKDDAGRVVDFSPNALGKEAMHELAVDRRGDR